MAWHPRRASGWDYSLSKCRANLHQSRSHSLGADGLGLESLRPIIESTTDRVSRIPPNTHPSQYRRLTEDQYFGHASLRQNLGFDALEQATSNH
jgi:hypothetical protein